MLRRWRVGLVGVLVAIGLVARVSSAGAAEAVYVPTYGSNDVSAFSFDANGALSLVPGSPFGAGTSPDGLAVSPNGDDVYVPNWNSGNVAAFSIGPNGALSPVSEPPFSAGTNPIAVAITPDGTHLYVANSGSNNVSAFLIGSNGALSLVPGSPFSAGTGPHGVAVSPDGAHLYVVNSGSNNVSAFSIDANGALSPLSGSPFSAGADPFGVAITPDGGHLYVDDVDSNGVSAFSIGSDGTLSPVPGSPFSAGTQPDGMAVTPDGGHLYVADWFSADVSAFAIGADGALTPLAGSPFSAGTNPVAVAVTPHQGPVAAFSASAAPAGLRSAFDGSGSHDPDGTVVRYDWSFGDGTSAANAGPTPNHIYAAPGSYTVTLTVTDDAGCSTSQTFTGQTVSCNGSAAAQVSHQLTVSSSPPPQAPGAQPSAPQLTLGSVTVAGPRASVHLSCSGTATGGCQGSIAFQASRKGNNPTNHKPTKSKLAQANKHKRTEVTVGRTTFKLASGKSAALTIKLNPTGRQLLDKFYRLPTELTISGTTALRQQVTFAYRRVRSFVSWTWSFRGAQTDIKQLDVSGIPRRGHVTVSCDGGGCSSPLRSFTPRHGHGVTLTSSINKDGVLTAGAKLRITIFAPNSVAKVLLITTRPNNYPSVTEACLPPGTAHPAACA